jgi:hypothetical protein
MALLSRGSGKRSNGFSKFLLACTLRARLREFGNLKMMPMGNFYPKRTAVKLNIGKSSSINLYGEAARTVEKVTLITF